MLIAIWALVLPTAVHARERLAVAVVVQDEPVLSDSLTEVAVAELSAHDAGELVGLLEMRTRLPELSALASPTPIPSPESCLRNLTCARHLSELFGASRLLLGLVTAAADAYAIEWSTVDIASGERHLVGRARSRHDESQLIVEIRRGIIRAHADQHSHFENESVAEARGVAALASPPTPHLKLPREPQVRVVPAANFVVEDPSRQHRTLPYVGAALTIAAFTSAVVTGIVATGAPKGNTRRDAQDDYERRQQFGNATYGLLLAGSALGTATAVSWVWHWP
jgi:hypothetical protein